MMGEEEEWICLRDDVGEAEADTDFPLCSSEKAHSWISLHSTAQYKSFYQRSTDKCPWLRMPQTMQLNTGLIVFHHLCFFEA